MSPIVIGPDVEVPSGYEVIQELPDGLKLVLPKEKPKGAVDRLKEIFGR